MERIIYPKKLFQDKNNHICNLIFSKRLLEDKRNMKKFLTDIKNIRNAIDSNRLVVFAGAGVSIDAGIPLWGTLINEMKSEIDIPANESDYLRIAQMYFNERQQKEYMEKIRVVLNHKKAIHNEIHEAIFKLNPVHLITTNYDDLLEQVIRKESLPFSIVTKDKEFPYALNTNLLVKIHGDLDNSDVVLKEDDYLDYGLNHPLIESFIKSTFASKVVLFVGYSFSDINLKIIIQSVRNILTQDFQNAYLLSVDNSLHPAQRDYLKNKGINVIDYFDSGKEENYIEQYIKGNNALKKKYFKKGENFSMLGQRLLNFLVFLSNYDKFNDLITEKHIIDQLYNSLSRFSELRSLPISFISNLYPFKITDRYVYNFAPYTLELSNESLFKELCLNTEIANGKVKYNPTDKHTFSEIEIGQFEKKIEEIFIFLNYSGISTLYYKPESRTGDITGSQRLEPEKNIIIIQNEECQCFNCRYDRLEFHSLISDALNSSIHGTSSLPNALALAYINHKIGNIKQSYSLFQEIANKAWQSGKYLTYYIAKHNIKALRNLIKYEEENLDEDEKEKIIRELDDIDFDKLISHIPYLGDSQYKLLKIIRDDTVLKDSEANINEHYKNVLDTYEFYKEKRVDRRGTYYPQLIFKEIHNVILFYTNNYIIGDEYESIPRVINKGIEALLINYATDKKYEGRIQRFNLRFFELLIKYGDSKAINDIFNKFHISELVFSEEGLSSIVKHVNNFLKSFYEEDTFLMTGTSEEKKMKNQTSIYFFKYKCQNTYKNIFTVLAKISIPKADTSSLVNNILKFFKHESFLLGSELEYILPFIDKNFHLFSKDDIETLLETISKKYIFFQVENSLIFISKILSKNKFLIDNKSLVNDIVSIFKKDSYSKNRVLPYLWTISGTEIKVDLKAEIIKTLDSNLEIDLYVSAVENGVIEYERYFDGYIQKIEQDKVREEPIISSDKAILSNFTFMNAVRFIYSLNLSNNDPRLKSLTNLTEYMQFFLYPESFDYSKFKVEWLSLLADEADLFERFSKITHIKKAIEESLKNSFNQQLAKYYIKYFVTTSENVS
ncbi:SIR2 family protein [Flectobacillus longus]|uniref:SIR2 family protein n=1 Tax=Flectobacillus longus TaxID=2984207 RepID=UPI0024B693D6|nr:SIR2 family protein [Flectobacillus longus]MDI9882465.1 SIR2 family protein [Flectobacillus longus]